MHWLTGTFGRVVVGTDVNTGDRYAVKVCDFSRWKRIPGAEQKLSAEVGIMKCLDHPHVVALHDVFRDDDTHAM